MAGCFAAPVVGAGVVPVAWGDVVAAHGVHLDCTLRRVLAPDVTKLSRVEGCGCGRARPAAGGAQGQEAAPLVCPETLMHCLLWVACMSTSSRASALFRNGLWRADSHFVVC